MKHLLKSFARSEDGATAIEYALLACLMTGALLAMWPGFYSQFSQTWVNMGNELTARTK